MSRVERKAQAAEEQKKAIEERKKARKAQAKADKKIKTENQPSKASYDGDNKNTNPEGEGFKDKVKAKWNQFKSWFMAQPRWKKIVMVTASTIVTLLLIAVITVYAFFSSIFGDIFKATPEDYDLSLKAVNGYYNILLLGVDSRDMDNLEGTRSDAIMMVSISEKTHDVKILSVYRDTYLKMGDRETYDKITHACIYGGPEMTMKSLNQAMDLNISNYVVVNFNAVADLVDAVGGIEVDVQDYEIQQLNKYTVETAKILGKKDYKLVEKAGMQTLEGVQAVSYSRIRKGVGDDFKRTERMRTVLTLTMDKMKDMSFFEMGKIIKMMTPQVQTNISKSNILALAVRLPQYNILDTTGWPYNVTTGMINGASCVIPSDLASNVKQMHEEFFGQKDYTVSNTVKNMSETIVQKVNGVQQEVPDVEVLDEMEFGMPQPSEPVGDITENNGDTGTSTGGEGGNVPGVDTPETPGDETGSGNGEGTGDEGNGAGNGNGSGNAGTTEPDSGSANAAA